MSENVKHWIDLGAGALILFFANAAPVITGVSGLLAILWYSIRLRDYLKGKRDGN